MSYSPNNRAYLALLLVFCALVPTGRSWSLPEDRQQPMQVESDTASRDDRSRVTIYTGNVIVDQGTMHVEADKATVYMTADNKQIDRIVCNGRPATYRQLPKPGGELVKAHAEILEYQVAKDFIVLTHGAHLDQGGSTLDGEVVTYDVAKDLMQARGGDKNGRVRMVIPPQQKPATAGPAPQTPAQTQTPAR